MTDWKNDFSAGLRIMDGHGLTEGFGHLSLRLPDDSIAITPAQGPGMAAADALHCFFAPSGERLDPDALGAPLETPMHLAIYAARPDVHAICRTHSVHCVSWGVGAAPLCPTHGFGLMLGDAVPVHPVGDLIHTMEMGQGIATTLGNGAGILIKGNGALTVGDSIAQAVVRAIYLEEAARIAIQRSALPDASADWPEDELAARRQWHAVEAARAWDYYRWRYAR